MNDLGSEYLTDALMTETHAQDRNLSLHLADHILTDTGIFWISGSGREDDVVRMKVPDIFCGHRVVSDHPDIRFQPGRLGSGRFPRTRGGKTYSVLQTERAEKLDQIVRKAVIVIDQ